MLTIKAVTVVLAAVLAGITAETASPASTHSVASWQMEGVLETASGKGLIPGNRQIQTQNRQALADATKRCNPQKRWARRQFKNGAGMVLWKYSLQVYYCVRNGRVTYFRYIRWAEVNSVTPFVEWKPWEFMGHTGENVMRGLSRRSVWTQGHFQVCLVANVLLCNNQYPQLSITVNGDGTWGAWTKG